MRPRRNSDEDLQALLRRLGSEEDDADALIERLVREARRRGAWSYVNAAMAHANYPTWNRLAPNTYEGAAAWPEEELRVAAGRLHEMLGRVAAQDQVGRFRFRAHLWPLLEVLVGDGEPVRWVGQPGVRRVPHNRDDSAIVRAWTTIERPTAREYRADVLTGVLDREQGAITVADAWVRDGGHDVPALVDSWALETSPHRGGSWRHWARNTDSYDRVRIPVDLAQRWLAEARRTWGVAPERFLDYVRWAATAAERHAFPPGYVVRDIAFDAESRPTGFWVAGRRPDDGRPDEFAWFPNGPYVSPAAAAWEHYLGSEGQRRGFALDGPYASPFDPASWAEIR